MADSFSVAGGKLREFLWKYSDNKKIKLMPVGKNVAFDIKKITDQLLGAETLHQFVSYRTYDITSLIELCKRKGKLDRKAPDSLEALGEYFGIKFVAHTARGDNLAGIEIVKHLEALLDE
jgi:oligoribonuclease (3'-5' exoribonuclease)